MKISQSNCIILLIIFLIFFSPKGYATTSEKREIVNFNREWRFALGDHEGAETSNYNDREWEPIGLPHSFSIPYFLSPKFYEGYGWYRKQFNLSNEILTKCFFIEFEGVFQDAEVFVNGHRVGEHRGGYTGFYFEVTKFVHPGENLLAVRVNNLWDAQLAPRGGEHVFSGGIYRNVKLVITAPLHVTWYGTCVTTPKVSKTSGIVNVKTEVVNESKELKRTTIITRVLDSKGNQIIAMQSNQMIPPGSTTIFDQTSQSIPNPKLWSPEHHNLYSVKTTILDAGMQVDNFSSPLGFRWFKWTADKGFFLNGEHYYFKGANAHQDHAGWGDAVTDRGFYRDVNLIKEAGFDFIRGSHYPHAPAFANACDQIGMLFWSENCFWGTWCSGGFENEGDFNTSGAYPIKPEDQSPFEQSVRNSLRDMIRINRNHPSIIVWSMGNEDFFTAPATLPKVRNFLRDLVTYSHQLDSTRPAAIGGCQRGDLDKLGDIAGYNGDGARLFINPGIPNVVSEYGSTISDRPGKYEPGWGDLSIDSEKNKAQLYDWCYPWRSGEALWCAFDHGSMAGNFGCMGMIDYFRLPKRMWYWYRNEYRHIPHPAWAADGTPAALKISADRTTLKSVDGTDDSQIIVNVLDKTGKALSNSPSVTLKIVSGPGEFPTGSSITFDPKSDIAIRDGKASIEFRSYSAGKTVILASSPGLRSSSITITSTGRPKFIPSITPYVKQHPYIRYTNAQLINNKTSTISCFGLQNPTLASSEKQGHSGKLANDGNPTTFWEANVGDSNAWWQVDMERIVLAKEIKLTFPLSSNWHYRIEISEDGINHWELLSDQTQSISVEKINTIKSEKGVRGRFLRVTFIDLTTGTSAGIAEIEIHGQLLEL